MVVLVPDWLVGVWRRDYIRRARPDGSLGPADRSVSVLYVQTPWAFVDVRRGGGEGSAGANNNLAFAGVTSVVVESPDAAALVSWHACLDFSAPLEDAAERWACADEGFPKPTTDQGYFTQVVDDCQANNNVWCERDPQGTLEEQWVRVHDGGGQFLALRRGNTALLVLAGPNFAYADSDSGAFLAGSIDANSGRLFIELSVPDTAREGTFLTGLAGTLQDWTVLPGSSSMDRHTAVLHPLFGG